MGKIPQLQQAVVASDISGDSVIQGSQEDDCLDGRPSHFSDEVSADGAIEGWNPQIGLASGPKGAISRGAGIARCSGLGERDGIGWRGRVEPPASPTTRLPDRGFTPPIGEPQREFG